MRVLKSIGLGLAVLLLTQTFSACTMLRTPYEKAKINENGGTVEAPEDAAGSDRGGGEEKKGGGGKQEKADPGKFKVEQNRAETYNQRRARDKQGGALYSSPYSQDTERMKAQKEQQKKKPKKSKASAQSVQPATRLSYNKGLSNEVSKVDGVNYGTVLIDRKHNAYVALDSDTKPSTLEGVATQVNKTLNIKAQGEVPADIQRKVAERLRAADDKIGTVFVTNDPSHVKTFDRYAQEMRNGTINQMSAEALTEHIEDIWKK
ncbi:MAG: YhcN/YlaJ family sporulation lipoprotein [Tumebacillaceae bacterium]